MRPLTRIERKAAMAVLSMAAAVAVSGYRLLKRHTEYMAKKAAAHFDHQDMEDAALYGEDGFAEEEAREMPAENPVTEG